MIQHYPHFIDIYLDGIAVRVFFGILWAWFLLVPMLYALVGYLLGH
jgi:hypothetical protein